MIFSSIYAIINLIKNKDATDTGMNWIIMGSVELIFYVIIVVVIKSMILVELK